MPDSGDSVDLAVRFREFLGTFVEHCHNTQHEDHAMLLRFDVERPGQVRVMPTPIPSWEGVGYVPSFALPTFRTGDPDFLDQDINEVLVDDVLRGHVSDLPDPPPMDETPETDSNNGNINNGVQDKVNKKLKKRKRSWKKKRGNKNKRKKRTNRKKRKK